MGKRRTYQGLTGMRALGLLRHHLLYGFLEKSDVHVIPLGSPCAWNICPDNLDAGAAIICAGAGGDISFEIELHRLTKARVILLDPSPTGELTVKNTPETELHGIEYLKLGLAARSGPITFSLPIDAMEGSYSPQRSGAETVTFECLSLQNLMERYSLQHVDFLKMDIEGFEWAVLDEILGQKIPIKQICVEFHSMHGRYRSGLRRYLTVLKMWAHGYRLISHQGIVDHTFLKVGFSPHG